MKAFACIALLLSVLSGSMAAQDSAYNTDVLKSRKRITDAEWKQMQDNSAARLKQFDNTNAGDMSAWAQKGYTVLKMNQTLKLDVEVNALFESLAYSGQNAKGEAAVRKRNTFKIGPGQFEIKDGIIKRIQ